MFFFGFPSTMRTILSCQLVKIGPWPQIRATIVIRENIFEECYSQLLIFYHITICNLRLNLSLSLYVSLLMLNFDKWYVFLVFIQM